MLTKVFFSVQNTHLQVQRSPRVQIKVCIPPFPPKMTNGRHLAPSGRECSPYVQTSETTPASPVFSQAHVKADVGWVI